MAVIKSAVWKAKLGDAEELAAIQRLDDQALRLGTDLAGPSVAVLIAEERIPSYDYGGHSVFG